MTALLISHEVLCSLVADALTLAKASVPCSASSWML